MTEIIPIICNVDLSDLLLYFVSLHERICCIVKVLICVVLDACKLKLESRTFVLLAGLLLSLRALDVALFGAPIEIRDRLHVRERLWLLKALLNDVSAELICDAIQVKVGLVYSLHGLGCISILF